MCIRRPPQKRGVGGSYFCNSLIISRHEIWNPPTPTATYFPLSTAETPEVSIDQKDRKVL